MDEIPVKQFTVPDAANSGRESKRWGEQHEISVYVGNKPAFQCLKYLGLLPMVEGKDGRLTFQWRSLSTLLSFVTVCIWFVVGVYHGNNIYHYDKTTLSIEEEILLKLLMFFMAVPILGLTLIFDTKSIAEYLENFREYQEFHEKTTSRFFKIDHTKRLKVIICACIVKTLILSALATYAADKITKSHGMPFQLTFFLVSVYLLSILDAIVGTYLSILLGLREIAEDLRVNLMKSDLNARTLMKYSQQWRELSMLTDGMTDAFKNTLAPYMAISFIICFYCWWLLALKIGNIHLVIFLCVITSVLIFIVPELTQRTNTKVGSLMTDDFFYLKRKGLRDDQMVEIIRFEGVLHDYPPNIQFLGCITLDRNVILGAFSQFVQAMAVIREIRAEDTARFSMRLALASAADQINACGTGTYLPTTSAMGLQ